MSFVDRLQRTMRKMNVTQTMLAEKLKLPQQTVHRLVSGLTKRPSGELVLAIAKILGVAVEWLEHGKTPDAERTNSLYSIPKLKETDIAKWLYAGNERHTIEQERMDMYQQGYEECFSYTVNVDFIAPTINFGDVLVVDPTDHEYKNGNILVVKEIGEKGIHVKKYVEEGGLKFLQSFNAGIPSVPFDNRFDVYGKAKVVRSGDRKLD